MFCYIKQDATFRLQYSPKLIAAAPKKNTNKESPSWRIIRNKFHYRIDQARGGDLPIGLKKQEKEVEELESGETGN